MTKVTIYQRHFASFRNVDAKALRSMKMKLVFAKKKYEGNQHCKTLLKIKSLARRIQYAEAHKQMRIQNVLN
jgi:hypothetical protein